MILKGRDAKITIGKIKGFFSNNWSIDMPTPDETIVEITDFIRPHFGQMRWRVTGNHVSLDVLQNGEYTTLYIFIHDGVSVTSFSIGEWLFEYPHSTINLMPRPSLRPAVPTPGGRNNLTDALSYTMNGSSSFMSHTGARFFDETSHIRPQGTLLSDDHINVFSDEVKEENTPSLPRGERPLRKLRMKNE